MIYYLTSRKLAPAMQDFLAGAGKRLAPRVRLAIYRELFAQATLYPPRGVYIFTALGNSLGAVSPPSRARRMAARLHAYLVERHGADKVLNHPLRSMGRFELLGALYERGINSFDAWLATDPAGPRRFPVILRRGVGTEWGALPLLRNRQEYAQALAAVRSPEQLIAVEFCDTRQEGIFAKYGAFVAGGRIVPRHAFYSRHWMVKLDDIVTPQLAEEELEFMKANPHAELLAEVCRIARIGYGRIDYSLLNGRPQIWEINASPSIVFPGRAANPLRSAANALFTDLFIEVMQALDS